MSLIRYFALGAVIQMLCVSSCSAPDSLTGRQGPNPVHAYARMDSLAEASIRERAFPGAAVAIGRGEDVHRIRGYGTYTYESGRRTTPQSLFDVASLTKVVATTTASMLLYEQGLLDLDATVRSYLPEFDAPDKSEVTLRHLLTHTSGFIPFRPFYEDGVITRRAVIDSIFTIPLESIPGEEYAYSDFGMITLALVIEAVTGRDFASYTAENVFRPLGMLNTGFRGIGLPDTAVVPTERDDYFRYRLVQGEVHDENAWILGGAAGHAGLFSSADDLSRFAAMMSQGGRYEGGQFLSPETVTYFTTVVDTAVSSRALGWDTRDIDKPSSSGAYFGPRSYGHTGFTGTSIWIDPDAGLYVIFLTNRVYPKRDNAAIGELRPLIADLAWEAVIGLSRQ